MLTCLYFLFQFQGLLITTLLIYRPPSYEGYEYGTGAVAFGWIVASVTFVPVPVYAIYILCKTEGSFLQVTASPGGCDVIDYVVSTTDRFLSPCNIIKRIRLNGV